MSPERLEDERHGPLVKLGPETWSAVDAATIALGPHADQNDDQQAAVAAIEAFLTEASQSCPELLLRLALTEKERHVLLNGLSLYDDRRISTDPDRPEIESARRKLNYGGRNG